MEEAILNREKKNFDFVNTIRCISMMGIVWEHSASLWGVKYSNSGDTALQIASMQFFKFATIVFFLIGGFLINHKFTEYTASQYIKRRFSSTVKPWLFWIMVLVIANVIQKWIVYHKGGTETFLDHPFAYFIEQFRYILFESSFWFILNFLICITLLLLFKKYLYKIWFGLVLLFISLIYSANLYFEWFVTRHSIALFGFVFYLWLGVYFNRYYEPVLTWINKISWWKMLAMNMFTFVLACVEIWMLMERGSHDEYNTLRISNIAYSLTMFMLLLKFGNIKIIDKYLTPRKSTFGIYLIHQILIIRLLPEIFKGRPWIAQELSVYQNIGYSLLRFLIVYLISLLVTKALQNTKWKWLIGN
ncbi:acyltransferase family protein [Nubsella zeaxanthinifaciens]|uniref:acyltransferase family protein n=1 Tax=Nubsella zeaxanthinifaciens TaxID=392412 RepID=UPI003CFE238C